MDEQQSQYIEVVPEDVDPVPRSGDRQAEALLNGKSDASNHVEPQDFAEERLKHQKQQRVHKRVLFWTTLLLTVGALIAFGVVVSCSERLIELLKVTPFALGVVALLGIIPTVLIIMLFRCVFQSSDKGELLSRKDIDAFKELTSIAKELSN